MAISTALPIKLSTVITEIGLPTASSLADCFAAATGTFNATYAKAGGDWLTEFRGYVHSAPCNTTTSLNLYPLSGQATSGSGTCPTGGVEVPHYFYPTATNVVAGVSTVTTDSNGCSAFNGGSQWYRVRSNGGEASTFYSVQISSTGAVTGKVACT